MGVVAVALELQHAVDEVLEDARPGNRAVLRHVPDEERRDAALLRDAQQPAGGLAHLGTRSRAPSRAPAEQSVCTESITQTARAARVSSVSQTDVELGLGEDLDVRRQPPSRAARSFTCATDSSPVIRSARRSRLRSRRARCRSSVDLPTPGLAADEDERRGHEPAAEHAVELRDAGGDPLRTSSASTSTSRSGVRAASRFGPPGRGASATSVPNSPQPGQRPSHRPDAVPHSLQTCRIAAGLAIGGPPYSAAPRHSCRVRA